MDRAWQLGQVKEDLLAQEKSAFVDQYSIARGHTVEESYHSSIIGLVFSNMKSTNKGTAQLKHGSGSNYRLRPHSICISRRYLFLEEILYRKSSLVQALELSIPSFIPYPTGRLMVFKP